MFTYNYCVMPKAPLRIFFKKARLDAGEQCTKVSETHNLLNRNSWKHIVRANSSTKLIQLKVEAILLYVFNIIFTNV